MKNWYLVYTKPRQEAIALENLERQGYECYMPMLTVERLQRRTIGVVLEPLFPRYLFIRLDTGSSAKAWGPIRSTRGVCRLVGFGTEPARVDERLVDFLRGREEVQRSSPERLFNAGDRVELVEGSFTGLEAIYQMDDGAGRAMVLIELLSRQVTLRMPASSLRKLEW